MLTGCQTQRPLPIVERSAVEALQSGMLATAEAEYAEILERRPERWDARYQLADIYLRTDRPAEALEQLDIVYTFAPADKDVLDRLADAAIATGKIDTVLHKLRSAARAHNRWEDWLRLGRILRESGDLDAARPALVAAAVLDNGEHLRPQLELARLHAQAGDTQAALERYRMALYLDPNSAESRSAIREAGMIPGPTIAIQPIEQPNN
ncbi:MAG: tetratricopeptide repeat protein [Planctomycetota bacterium]